MLGQVFLIATACRKEGRTPKACSSWKQICRAPLSSVKLSVCPRSFDWAVMTAQWYALRLKRRETTGRVWTLPYHWVGKQRSRDHLIERLLPDFNLRYQKPLDWRKWIKGGRSFPICPRSFARSRPSCPGTGRSRPPNQAACPAREPENRESTYSGPRPAWPAPSSWSISSLRFLNFNLRLEY